MTDNGQMKKFDEALNKLTNRLSKTELNNSEIKAQLHEFKTNYEVDKKLNEINIDNINKYIDNQNNKVKENHEYLKKNISELEKRINESLDEVIQSEKETRDKLNHQLSEIFMSFTLAIMVWVIQKILN